MLNIEKIRGRILKTSNIIDFHASLPNTGHTTKEESVNNKTLTTNHTFTFYFVFVKNTFLKNCNSPVLQTRMIIILRLFNWKLNVLYTKWIKKKMKYLFMNLQFILSFLLRKMSYSYYLQQALLKYKQSREKLLLAL